MTKTLLDGTQIKSGSIPTTALGGGVVSSSAQASTWTVASASVAITASYAVNATATLPSGLISSSTQVNYTELQNIPSGIVSSSSQISTGSFSGSFTGVLLGTSSWANNAISASVATTASYALNSIPLPPNLVSSSTQIDYTQIQNKPTTIETASYVEYNNVANKPSLISSSTQVSYIQLSNIPSGIISSSAQINNLTGVSASFATTASAATSITFTPTSASYAVSASYVPPSFIDNLITVGLAGSNTDFTSIKAAVDSITDASSNNTYTVRVYPGTYIEDTITLKPYIAVKGDSSVSTIVSASNPNNSIFVMADQTMVIDMQIQGSTGTNASAVVYSSPTTPQTNAIAYVENVRFGTNYTNAKVVGSGSSGNCILQCSNVKYGGFTSGSKSFDVGFYVTSGSDGGIGRMQLRNVTSTNGGVAGTDNDQIFALADAPGCTFIVNGCLLTRATGTVRGTAFKVYNGGQLRLTGVNFQRWIRGIWAPQIGSAPSIDAIALNFENCTTDVQIDHSGSLGKIQGTDTFLKTIINKDAPLYEVNQDPRKISVAKKGGDFSSISASVAYITDSAENNRYVIEVGPGEFAENQIDMRGKPYIAIVGADIQTTVITPTGSGNYDQLILGPTNDISFLSFKGNNVAGYSAITAQDLGSEFAQAHKVSIYDYDYGIKVLGNVSSSTFYGEYIDINGSFSYGTYVSSSNTSSSLASMENYYLFPSNSAAIGNYAVGPSSSLSLYTCLFKGDTTAGSTTIKLENGAVLEGAGLDIQDWDYGLRVPAGGAGPEFRLVGAMIHDSVTYDFDVLNASTRGRFQGVSNHTKINNISQDFYWNFLDDEDGENDVTRKLSVTFADGTHTDATTLIFKGSPMGVMQGGTITTGSGFGIVAASGFGYLQDTIDADVYKRLDWINGNLTLTANTDNYIYITDAGTLTSAGSIPDNETNIILGRVVTNDTTVEFIDQAPYNGEHMSNKLSTFNREALGPVFAAGSTVTEDATPFTLDVTAGTYFYSENKFTPAGTSSINLNQYYPSASVWGRYTSSIVPSSQYASASALVSMSANYYTKHTVYLVGDGADEKYFLVLNSNQYSTLVEAENANLPSIPSYFNDGVVPLAAVYVQSGSANITQIQDIRPIIGFRAAGVNASSVHGNLLGLNNDDHTQYLLVNGGRAMAGNLSMGGNNITNIGTLIGTASWANNAVTASAATSITFTPPTASFSVSSSRAVTIFPFVGDAIISGSLRVSGSATSSLIVDQNRISIFGSSSFNGPISGTHAAFSQMYNENSTVAGIYLGRNTQDNTPRVGFFNGTTAENWQIDNSSGQFRWYTPSITRMTLTTSGVNTVLRLLGSGSVITSEGSISASRGITGSLFGTSSWASNAISSSFTNTASAATSITFIPSTASFATTASFVNILNQTVSASGEIAAGTNLVSNFSSGDEGGEIRLARPQTNTSISGSVKIDVYQNRIRIFEADSPNRGGYWDITTLGSNVGTNLAGGAGTVTSVTAGNGLTGGTITGAGTITVDTGSAHFVTGSIGVLNARNVVSSSTQVSYTQLQNIPANIVSSSAQVISLLPTGTVSSSLQINTGSFSGSFVGTLTGTSSWATNAVNAQSTPYSGLTGVPVGILSSSTQINQLVGVSSSFATTASFATSASFAPTILPNGVISSSTQVVAALPAGTVSSSTQVNYTQLQNIPSGIISSSAQVTSLLPSGVVSSSLQINTGSFSGSFTGNFIGTSSWASNAISSSFATTASAATSITFTPSTASFATTASFAVSASWAPSIGGVTSITAGDGLTGGTINSTGTITLDTGSIHFLDGVKKELNTEGVISSSAQVISLLPVGTVSSSLQINTGSFSGSFTGTLLGSSSWAQSSSVAISSSFATTASFALNAGGSGFPYNGITTPAVISGSLIISGSQTQGLFVTGSTTVLGAFQATTKSFKIDHPTKKGKLLIYGSLESPYHGVRLTGKGAISIGNSCVIYLPEYIKGLCKQEGAQIQITNIRHGKILWVEELSVDDNYFIVAFDRTDSDNTEYQFYWSFTAIRKDVEDLQVEV